MVIIGPPYLQFDRIQNLGATLRAFGQTVYRAQMRWGSPHTETK